MRTRRLFASPLSALAATVSTLDEPQSRVVAYGDLDLSRDSGVATLYSRINSAARAVCEPLDVVMLKLFRESFDCHRGAAKTKAIAGNQR